MEPAGSLNATPDHWPEGYGYAFFESLPSTNAEAIRRVGEGERGPLWIVAAEQTAGRGRGGRNWSTARGNLAATLLAPMPSGGPGRAATLSFVAGLAVADMLAGIAGLEVHLKWPNDALVEGRKIAGVLIETDATKTVAVGVGVNLLHAPENLEGALPATSVAAVTGGAPEFRDAAAALARAWAVWYGRWEDGFEAVREAWLARAAFLGEEIEARLPRETLRGCFEGIDPDGALRLSTKAGSRRIAAADVFPAG